MKPKYIFTSGILLLCLFMPFEARADGISIPILLGGGLVVFTPVILFISLIEATVIFRPLRISFRYGFKIMLIANILSMLSGIPVKIVNAMFYHNTMPNDLYEYFKFYPFLVAVGTMFYFIVTVIVEYLYLHHVNRKKELKVNRKKLIKWVVIVNVISYSLMVPLNYYITRPQCDIEEFTRDSSWAQRPISPIYYIDNKTKCLAMIMSDGSNRKIIGKEPVPSSSSRFDPPRYHIDGKGGKRYYSKNHCGFDKNDTTEVVTLLGLGSRIIVTHKGKTIVLAINPGLLHLGQRRWSVALLPNGQELVFSDRKNIYLMDMEKKKVGTIASGGDFVLLTPLFLERGNN